MPARHRSRPARASAKPRFIRNFGLVGKQPGSPDSLHGADYDMHGPIRLGNRLYVGYNTFINGVIRIIDREKLLHGNPSAKDPFEPTDENLTYPVVTTF